MAHYRSEVGVRFAVAVFYAALLLGLGGVEGIKWLSLRSGIPEYGEGRCAVARELGVSPCGALAPLAAAARVARVVCRALCQHRRWDCSSLDLAPHFSPDLLLGTREQSFVYSLSSAALMHTMARACSSGALSACTCGMPPRYRPGPGQGFKWGGCSDNLRWAGRFVRQFVEVPEKMDGLSGIHNREDKEIRIYDTADRRVDGNGNILDTTTEILQPTTIVSIEDNLEREIKVNNTLNKEKLDLNTFREIKDIIYYNKSFGVTERMNTDALDKPSSFVRRETKHKRKSRRKGARRPKKAYNTKETLAQKLERLQPYISLANLQNSKVGRKIVERALRTECKCHGVSGSCSVRTCWRALPPLRNIGAALLADAQDAARVRAARPVRHYALGRRGARSRRGSALLYVSPSPDYCRRDPDTGSLGTSGRWCNGSLSHGESSCRALCCGRGHQTHSSSHLERCHCKYIWCCRVECQLCKVTTDNHYCN